jgi:hypothetical protein
MIPIVGSLDEVFEHLFGDIKISDHSILHRLDGNDIARCSTQHFLGFSANGFYLVVDLINGNDGRLVDNDSLASGINKGIGGTSSCRRFPEKPDIIMLCPWVVSKIKIAKPADRKKLRRFLASSSAHSGQQKCPVFLLSVPGKLYTHCPTPQVIMVTGNEVWGSL